jgi:HSP20 family protein
MSLSLFIPNHAIATGFDGDIFPSSLPPTLNKRFKTDTMLTFSPRYEVTDNKKEVRIAVDVPGVKPDNMKVELEDDGHVVHMCGDRKTKTDNRYEEYRFDKRFTLGKDLDSSKLTAHLSDGVLVLTAPKKEKLPPTKQEIAIVQGEAPALEMEVEKEVEEKKG